MKIVGLDLSLTSTGIAMIGTDVAPAIVSVDRIRTKPAGDNLEARHQRMRTIIKGINTWLSSVDLVVIEGLAYASRSPHATERAGLWWLVIDHLHMRRADVAVVAPTARAKYATGKGNAPKDQVLAAVIRRYPDVEITGNDEADALILAAMGARALSHPIEPRPDRGTYSLPDTHLAALDKVAWPDVTQH